MSDLPLRIAVVGHTNTGKTSLVRTLMHDRRFGEVRDRGGTTRQITRGELVTEHGHRIELFDSPGLENAPELIEWLDAVSDRRHDGPERIRHLLDHPDAAGRFDHETRVLGLMRDIDIALYVIDAREPVLEKYKDELAVLGLCARPIVAVLNFVAAAESREHAWREALARVNLHTVLAFDAAVREPATELALFEKLRSQLDRHRTVLDAWLDHRRAEEVGRRRAGLAAIAAMLIDVAAMQRSVPAGGDRARRARDAMQRAVVEREQACVDTLLELYRFGRENYDEAQLPISAGRWRADPFDAETLRHYGIRASGFAAAGAGAGAAVDLGTGGLSLGAGTVTGTVLGVSAGLLQSASRRWIDRARGLERLRVDDAVVRLLMARSLELLLALVRRGHGNPEPIRPGLVRAVERRLPRSLRRARHHPAWSALNDGGAGSGRDAAVAALADSLEDVGREAAPADANGSGPSRPSD